MLRHAIRWRQRRDLKRSASPVREIYAHGVRVFLDLRDLSDYVFYRSMVEGGYEEELVQFATSALRPGDVCLDVGANRGYLSLVFAKLVGATGRVHAFEPEPATLSKLRYNLQLNWRLFTGEIPVVTHPVAAWDENCEVDLHSSLIEHGRDSVQPHSGSTGTRVRAMKVDDELEGEKRPVRLAKIDVEGSELRALRGMRNLIDRSPDIVLLIEWNRSYATFGLWDELCSRFTIAQATSAGCKRVTSPKDLRGILTLVCTKRQ